MWKGSVYEILMGVIMIFIFYDKFVSIGCVNNLIRDEIYFVWSYWIYVLFEDNIFEGNVGLIVGVVYVSNGYIIF